MNYRDMLAVTLIGSYGVAKLAEPWARGKDNEQVFQHIYTDDESDVDFRNTNNKTDAAVRVKKVKEFRARIEAIRAEKERAAQLDAYNYLNSKSLQL